jgi:hypothetical protein
MSFKNEVPMVFMQIPLKPIAYGRKNGWILFGLFVMICI